MPQYKIKLRNIKNIASLEMIYPQRSGVYLISGSNGCGKSTLLVSLHRLCDKNAFSNYFPPTPLYSYQDAEIEYIINQDSVIYKKNAKRWPPHPRNKKYIIDHFPPQSSLLLTASGIRFFSQAGNVIGARMIDASDFIKNSMNRVFGTTIFSNLKYKQIKPKRGRIRIIPRPYKLYVMAVGHGKNYDENNFSLGERLVLNTLELISIAAPNSQILIDEVELALHPVAQANFYRLLEELARDRSLYIFISSHSATLVKIAINNLHLHSDGLGNVEVQNNAYPAYILSDIGVDENFKPDKIFFVEDSMAAEYVRNLVNRVTRSVYINPLCVVIPVGGYSQVVDFLRNYRTIEPNQTRTHALVDADVKETFCYIRRHNPRDPFVAKFEEELRNRHLDYLDITPEVGFWDWISNDGNYFKNLISADCGMSLGTWNINDEIRRIEDLPQSANIRQTAKTRLSKLIDVLKVRMPDKSEIELIKLIIRIYVNDKCRDNEWFSAQKRKLLPFLKA